MKLARHKASGRWFVRIPAKQSDSGRREMRYFDSKQKALDFIAEFKNEKTEHGKQAVTSEERHWINVARTELGELSILPEVIRHWKRTGAVLNPIGVQDACQRFLDDRKEEYPNKRTWHDVRWRLNAFSEHFKARQLHEIGPGDIETFLKGFSLGWNRRSVYKRLRPFLAYAERRRWVAINPMEQIEVPKTPLAKRNVYTPEDFEHLLLWAEWHYEPLLPFVALAGFAFMRTRELVRMYANESVLRWENILWEQNRIHVPESVGKATRRRSGNERFCPINDSLRAFLYHARKESGDIMPMGQSQFSKIWHEMTDKAEIKRIDNGLRKSAISYCLAANPEVGIALVAQWAGNSEAAARAHYVQLLTKEQGEAWFNVKRGLETIPARLAVH
jgi:hypothetical protein